MKRGFKIDKKKKVSKEAVCSYFGERGMQVAPAEVAFHAFGTYTDNQLKTMPAIAVIIKESPKGFCEMSDTADGRMDIYSLTDIYGECQDEVPAPLYAIAAAKRATRPAKR
jgi:hypothetical protein